MTLLTLISIGPGRLELMTRAALDALQRAEIIIGYGHYLGLVQALLRPEQDQIVSPLGQEMARAEQAIRLAQQGRRVALISSGDIGIYAMAGPVFEVLRQQGWQGDEPEVQVYPGVSAIQAVAARIGAPIAHDFCTISLSDLLTPWAVIERRVQAAAWGDFVIGFYNPRSRQRDWQLKRAEAILLAHRAPNTPVAVARNVTRPDETLFLTTLSELNDHGSSIDMFTLIVVGNSQSYTLGHSNAVNPRYFATPRGYAAAGQTTHEQISPPGWGEDGPPLSPRPPVYPITLTKVAGTLAVVVGGGPVGERKVRGLLQAKAIVRLISPEATPQLSHWAQIGQVQWQQRPYQAGDLRGVKLAFAATNHRPVNAAVAEEARLGGILCNVADAPEAGNFHLPAIHRRVGPVNPNSGRPRPAHSDASRLNQAADTIIAVSTAGRSPKQAQDVRDQIAKFLDEGGPKA